MAYTVVPTILTDDVWTAANGNTFIKDNFAAILSSSTAFNTAVVTSSLTQLGPMVTYGAGAAVTAGNYQVGRDADGTNQLHLNVPTGAGFEFSINDSAEIVYTTGALALQQTTAISVPAGDDITLGDDLTLIVLDGGTGTIGMGPGNVAVSNKMVEIGGNLTGTSPIGFDVNVGLTSDAGGGSFQAQIGSGPISTGGFAMTNIGGLRIVTPDISVGGGSVSSAMTLQIDGAPTEGSVANWAINIGGGDSQTAGDWNFNQGALRWSAGVAVVSTEYSIQRNADSTDQLHFNVPSGAGFEFSVADTGIFFVDGGAGSGHVGIGLAPGDNNQFNVGGIAETIAATNIRRALFSPNGAITLGQATTTFATLWLTEPQITLDGNTLTNAATLYVQNAPTEATNNFALFVDAGSCRFDGSIFVEGTPTEGSAGEQLESAGAGAVTIWAAAGCIPDSKKDILLWDQPGDALQLIVNTPIYRFHYKDKNEDATLDLDGNKVSGVRHITTGDTLTEYVGPMANEASWAMHHEGKIINPINTFGYTALAIQELDRRLTAIGA